MSEDTLIVKTYSGRTYAERPVSFVWQGAGYEILEVEETWLEPGQRHFRVRTTDSRRFHLWHDEAEDRWALAVEQ